MSRTIMIMAGGTGGHIFPALSVAEYLRGQGWRIVWLGARRGMEARIVPRHGYIMAWIRFSGLRGTGVRGVLLLPLRLLVAFWQSARAIFRHRPDVVLGMGGYVAFPGAMMASLFSRPLVIHEQNAVAGLANRVLARLADRVLVAFPDALSGSAVTCTGNPVRADVAAIPLPETRFGGRAGVLRLLVLGGSLGAQALNDVLPQALALMPPAQRPLVTHQAGERNINQLTENYRRAAVDAEVLSFIDDMAARYAACDLVVCRAGASTIAEIAVVGLGAVLVPYPHAVDDHQTHNAAYLAGHGAAIVIAQGDLTPARLAGLLAGLTRERLLEMAKAARGAGRPDATQAVALACAEVAA